jgi:SAM-dependent methyltransferase
MDNTEVYDKFDWSKISYNFLKGKIDIILNLIPKDVKTIIDIGCGNGVITNQLAKHYDVTGIDRSENALKTVETSKLVASADSIPLGDYSFDMVFSSELLEHLDDDLLKGTVSEIKRLSNKYIFISVPNNENPNKLSIGCPKCNYIYNSPNHLRNFNPEKLHALFSEYKLIKTITYGKKIRYYNNNILKLKIKLSPSKSWIPYFWMAKGKRKTTCPNCEHTFENSYKFNLFATTCDLLNAVISPKKPYWLFAIFEKV